MFFTDTVPLDGRLRCFPFTAMPDFAVNRQLIGYCVTGALGQLTLTLLSCGWLAAISLTSLLARADPVGVAEELLLDPLLDPPHPTSSKHPAARDAATAAGRRRVRKPVSIVGMPSTVA